MFSKEEARKLKTEFWTSFGFYMKKHRNHRNEKINWVNYKTKCKDIYFRLDVDNKKANFSIDIQQNDEGIRTLFYEQFTELKTVLNSSFEYELEWDLEYYTEHGVISRIGCELKGISVNNKNTWKEIFLFMERNILDAHNFCEDFGEIFIALEE